MAFWSSPNYSNVLVTQNGAGNATTKWDVHVFRKLQKIK